MDPERGPLEAVEYTTLVVRHIPTWLLAEDVQTNIAALTKETFNLFFLGVNPYNGQNAGTVILNYKDTDTASRVKNELWGWIQWRDADGSEEWAWINTAWSSTQGLLRNIHRYDHTGLFAEDIPDGNRPWVFDEQGERRSNHSVFTAIQKPYKSLGRVADSDPGATLGADQRHTAVAPTWRYVRRRELPTRINAANEHKPDLRTQEGEEEGHSANERSPSEVAPSGQMAKPAYQCPTCRAAFSKWNACFAHISEHPARRAAVTGMATGPEQNTDALRLRCAISTNTDALRLRCVIPTPKAFEVEDGSTASDFLSTDPEGFSA